MVHRCGDHDEARFLGGVGGRIGDGIAPRLFGEGETGLRPAGPDNNPSGDAAGTGGAGDRSTEQAGGENRELRKHLGGATQKQCAVSSGETLRFGGGWPGVKRGMDFTKIPEHQVTTIGDEERALRRKRWLMRGVGVLVAVGTAGWFYFSWRADQNEEQAAVAAAQAKLAGRVMAFEKSYRTLVAGGEVSAEALVALDGAIAAERERQRISRGARREDQRYLEGLERERDNWLGRAAVPRLASLEAAAAAQADAGEMGAAVESLRQALALQRAINGGSAAAKVKDYVREARLAQALVAAEVAPLKREVQEALAQATEAEAGQRWVDAREAYVRARAAQLTLNQKYPGSRFSDTQQFNRIEQELASLQAADAAAAVQRELRRADEALAAGRPEEAASVLMTVRTLQVRLNEQFSRSRFASAERIEAIETKRETILAADELAAVRAGVEAAVAALRQRKNVNASDQVASALERVERIGREWPRRLPAVVGLKAQLSFLSLRRADLGSIQDEVLSRLVALPGSAGLQLLATEVPQELYARVMNTNPSRNTGRSVPVDSVSWRDAQEFCERLGWVLGRPVRLPSEAEWRAGIGAEAVAGGWSRETAGGNSREAGKSRANAAGFFDLIGNLAEWLEPTESNAATAPVAGGSFLDREEELKTGRVERFNKGERARHVGFRFIVEPGK